MKVTAIILALLVLQTSASFFDEFRGAVSSVESSFGKLLTDVIYDVRETIDCTLLAVEQVLALGVFGDSSDYDRRCRDGTEPAVEPVVMAESEPVFPPAPDTSHEISIPELSNKENRQIDKSILDVDEVLCDVLNKDDTHAQLEGVKLALQNETARLTEISELLRKQLDELSNEVKEKFKVIELQTSEPSVETIWNDIKLLHEMEYKHKNTAEAKKISHILDQILSILDANEEDRSTADDYKVKEIMRKLSKHSKDGGSDLWKDSDYPKDFREYAHRIFDESRSTSSPDDTSKKEESEVDKNETSKETTTVKPKQRKRKPPTTTTTTTTTEKPLTVEELAAAYGSLFDVMPDIDNISTKEAVESAKNIIEETKLNDMVMSSLANMGSNKGARNLFDNPDLLDKKN